jgi:hypothetical protein
MNPELEATIKRLRGEDKGVQFQAPITSLRAKDKGVETFKFDVSRDAIYDKLSDGSYIQKFENYKGGVGNEERLANQQGFGEKALYGLGKFIGKTGKNALDATVGTVYGVINGLVEGDMKAVWDNDFSNKMDDWNKQMNYKLPHYYTEEEKNRGFVGSMGTANFWFNDVGDGLAFVAGALLPELAIGAATGGASLGVSMGKFAFRSGAKALYKEGVEKGIGAAAKKLAKNTDDFFNYSKGREGIREMYRGALNSKKAGDVLSTAGFMFRTSNFEAGMEARHNFHDAIDAFNRDFEEKNGRPPTLSEIGSFSESAKNAANGVYGANLAILSVSNAAMFGKVLDVKLPKIGEKINNRFNRAIGLGVNTAADGTMTAVKANKLQKLTGNAYKVLSKPAIEGIYEEGLQGVAGKTMQNYLDSKYDPNNNHAHSMWSSLSDAFAEQYGTKEGWKEMGIGMIIGMIGPTVLGQGGISGFGKDSRKNREAQIAEDITKVNKGIETLRGMDRASSVRNFRNVMESKAENFESTSAENTLANVEFVRSQEHIKGTSDIIKDYNAVIDNMELDQTQMEELQQSGIDIDTYKSALKDEFKQDIDNYNFAKKAVEAVGLDKVVDTTRGNRATIQEAMIMNIVLGKDALGAAKNTAEQLDKIIKPAPVDVNGISSPLMGGIFDHLQFYNNLQDEQKQSAQQLRQKKKELKALQDKNLLYQQELAGLQTRRKRKLKDSTLETNINSVSEKAAITVGQITKLTQEVENLEQALQSSATVNSLDIDGKVTNNVTNIVETLEELDKLEAYQESLRKVGKNNEADSIQYLTEQFKFHSDNHREMMNAHRRMLDTNFFNSKRGTSFIGKLIGQPYKMSDDFRQLIKDNDAVIDASLGLVNIRGYETVEQLIQESLEENTELSDREKYKLESMIRIQLNMGAIQDRVNSITSINTEYASEEEIANDDPLEGDTIRLKRKLDLDKRNLDNLDEINKVIKEITDQLDIVRNEYNQQKIEELEARLEELRGQQQTATNTAPVNTLSIDSIEETVKLGAEVVEESFEDKVAKKVQETLESFLPPKSKDEMNDWSARGEQPTSEEQKAFAKEFFEKVAWAMNNNPGSEADIEGAKKRYRELSKEVHPDRQNTEEKKEVARQFFQAMVEAKDKGYINILNKLKESFDILIKEVDNGTFKTFVEKGEVSQEIIQNIATKIIEGKDLTKEEQAIRQSKSDEVERILLENVQQVPPTTAPTADNSAEIADIEKQIEALKEVKIINSPEIIRLTELLEKDDNDTISTAEYQEMQELQSSIDDWMMITGTVVEGIRLSDLIRQKHVLENTPITDIEKVEEVTPDQIFDTVKFNDNTGRVNYSYAQSPDAVTAIKKDGKIIVSGISPKDLQLITETTIDFEITDDGKNNIILTEQESEKINATRKIAILPTNKDLTTTYSVVIEFNPAMNGTIEGNRLKSPHGTEYSEAMETDVIYQLSEGNAVALDVDPSDIYNQRLIKEYNDAPKNTPEEIEEALEALRVGMVIKVKSGPNMDKFIAVLKGKNSKGTKNESDYKYEAFRNNIVDQAIAQGFLTATGKISLKSEAVSIEKVLLGHPSFNFRLNPDGTVSIKYERVSDSDVKKIVDIGYIENGKRVSKNGITTSDTTFISKFEEESRKNKVPYIVVEKNGKRIAYPVKLVPRERQDNKDFVTVFNNKNMTKTDKVVKLNQMLAARGIDIKVPGNAFTSIGQTNLNKEFLDEKLVQLDNIDYFRPLEDWISKDDNMAEIIKEQILVNIDLSNPFHSPKVKLDFKNVYEGITLPKEIMESLKASKKTQGKGKNTKSVVSSALLGQQTKCKTT